MPLNSVQLGDTGTRVSELALGTARFGYKNDAGNVFDQEQANALLDAYTEHGGYFIDTASQYGEPAGQSQRWIGDWLSERDRDDFVIASKVYFPVGDGPNDRGLGRKHVRRQVQQTLDQLRTDYLDLLYIHRWDDDTPVDELLRTLDEFVADGIVDYLGTSTREFDDAWKVAMANERAEQHGYEPFRVTQLWYNLVNRDLEDEYLDMASHYDLGIMPFSPLAGGFLTGKYSREEDLPPGSRGATETERFEEWYLTAENFDVLEEVEAVAAELDATPVKISVAWLLAHPDVTAPVIGPRTVEQLDENVAAVDVTLSTDQFERLAAEK